MKQPEAAGQHTQNQRPRSARDSWILRKLEDGFGSAFYVAALLLVAVSVWAAGASIVTYGWKSDAAAWVQAAGSIAAIVGATWLAQTEARRVRRVRREQNEEAAWYVRFAIVQAQLESHIIASEIVNRTKPIDEDDVLGWRQQAATSATSLTALSTRTDHIHPAVTQVLSNAKVLVDCLVGDLAQLAKLVAKGRKPKHELIGRIVAPHRALIELIDLYDARMRGVRAALDESSDALPVTVWASWNDNPDAPTRIDAAPTPPRSAAPP